VSAIIGLFLFAATGAMQTNQQTSAPSPALTAQPTETEVMRSAREFLASVARRGQAMVEEQTAITQKLAALASSHAELMKEIDALAIAIAAARVRYQDQNITPEQLRELTRRIGQQLKELNARVNDYRVQRAELTTQLDQHAPDAFLSQWQELTQRIPDELETLDGQTVWDSYAANAVSAEEALRSGLTGLDMQLAEYTEKIQRLILDQTSLNEAARRLETAQLISREDIPLSREMIAQSTSGLVSLTQAIWDKLVSPANDARVIFPYLLLHLRRLLLHLSGALLLLALGHWLKRIVRTFALRIEQTRSQEFSRRLLAALVQWLRESLPWLIAMGVMMLLATASAYQPLAIVQLGLVWGLLITVFAILRLAVQRAFPLTDREFAIIRCEQATARHFRRYAVALAAVLLVFAMFTVLLWIIEFKGPLAGLLRVPFEIVFLILFMILLRKRPYLDLVHGAKRFGAWGPRSMMAFRWMLVSASLIVLFSEIAGYARLAAYVARGTIASLASLIGSLVLGKILLEIAERILAPDEGWLHVKGRESGLPPPSLHQVHRLLSWIAVATAAAAALFGCLYAWGLAAAGSALLLSLLTVGIPLGDGTLSLLAVLKAAAILFLFSLLRRIINHLLWTRVVPSTGWDSGLANAVAAGVRYVLVLLSILLAVNTLGFDLTKLTILAGALSVGIGFGLQNIVNNFISGIILLIERPIKVGDVIQVDGTLCNVKRINIRSTVVETYERSSLFVPNSDLITSRITNWTHEDTVARVVIPVGVAYGSDVQLVRRLLLEAATSHELVLEDPAPTVYFLEFGDSSLNFKLYCWTGDIRQRFTVISDLHFAIDRLFREHRIEIPFPQREVTLKTPKEE